MINKKSTLIIGDVHGCFNQLLLLLKIADYNPKFHRLILLGDVINKGPLSLQTLTWIKDNPVEVILGNHELKFIHGIEQNICLAPKLEELKKQMGSQLPIWLDWIKSWSIYIEEENFLAIHGGLIPNQHPKNSSVHTLVNLRYWDKVNNCMANVDTENIDSLDTLAKYYVPWHDLYTDSKLVVYGHWARQGLKIKQNSIGLDTGCVYGGLLTGLWLPERKIIQTPPSKTS